MGALAELFSRSDALKRQLKDSVRNPLAYAQMMADRMREEQKDPMYAANWLTGGLGGVIKNKGGNWLADSVEDALRGLKKSPDLGNLNDLGVGRNSINSWVEGPLTKYVKTRMATPEDEVRKLAERGVLHFEPATIRERSPLMEKIVGRRETAGFPIQGLGDSPLARSWENNSDASIRNLQALDLSASERDAVFGGKTVPKETTAHEMNPFASGTGISDLGFPHLIDELHNALNPASGLPRNLLLTPEAVQSMSMEKAVRRVADINAWREAQKAEANRALAEQASLVREYPHSDTMPNPKGLRWVELKQQEGLPPGYELQPTQTGLVDIVGPGGRWAAKDEKEATEKAWGAARANGYNPLGDQLKYEGDTMGHCVGGYCDDVLSGRSRIFSLRDAKGEPHVTVEVAPNQSWGDKHLESFRKQAQDDVLARGISPGSVDDPSAEFLGAVNRRMAALAADNPPVSIVQIKGKQNRAPNDEYLPFVQDFVRNSPLGGSWSDVGDLHNTGLLSNKLHPSGFITRSELEEAAKNPPEGFSPEDFVWPDRYASGGRVELPKPEDPPTTGGSVRSPLTINSLHAIIDQLQQGV